MLKAQQEIEIIDAHTHLWRSLDHEKSALPLPGRRDHDRWGTPDAAVRMADRCGISKLVFLNVMPTIEMMAHQRELLRQSATSDRDGIEMQLRDFMVDRIRRQNEWACEVGHRSDRLVPFIGVQPMLGAEGAATEVVRARDNGAKGVKLQPGMNEYSPSDPVLWDMYEAAQELRMPIASDSGTWGGLGAEGRPFGHPFHFEAVLEAFPQLTFVMCHFPSAYWDERVELALKYPNLAFDLSGGFYADNLEVRDGHRALAEEDALRILRKVGVERFMFGSDGPSVMPGPYIEQILRLDLQDDELQLILSENARRLYSIRDGLGTAVERSNIDLTPTSHGDPR